MKKRPALSIILLTTLCLAALTSGTRANTLPAGKAYPAFQVGVTGFEAQISKEGVLSVNAITAGTPAEGKLQPGDVLLAVNGLSLKVQDPRPILGRAINAAEGRDGKMRFAITRDGKAGETTIQLEAIGSYSPTWPTRCAKSQRIIHDTAQFIVAKGGPEASITGYCEALFLLSTGDDQYLPPLKIFANSEKVRKTGSHTWNNGYHGIFLGEYYLRTGDKEVFPALAAICDDAKNRQYFGGWNHWSDAGPGYVTGGLMNAAGTQILTTLILARECGIPTVDEATYDRSLTFNMRFAGHGAVPYGDHHPTMYLGDNGKDGMLACALGLLPHEKFKGASQVLALSEADSYTMSEQGHGSPFGNQTWRGLASVLVPKTMASHYRRHMDELMWYYELCRMPGGGFKALPMPGSGKGSIGRAPGHETGLLAHAYTSINRQLRITGRDRTKYSVPHRPTPGEARIAHTDFQRADYIEGASDLGYAPHELYAVFSSKYGGWWKLPHAQPQNAAWYDTMMRHYNPMVRSFAARGMGNLGEPAIPHILKALESEDARLRVAGMEAISGVLFWGVGFTKVQITPAHIEEHFLSSLTRALKDPNAPMWEKRHALMALSRAENDVIAAQTDLIIPYLGDEEWFLRVAACTAIRPLIKETDLIKPFLPAVFAHFDRDTNLSSRRWGSTTLFKELLANNPDLHDEVIEGMARSVNAMPIRPGYLQAIDINNIFETLRYIDMKRRPQNAIPFLPAIERAYPMMSDQAAGWVFTGAKWGNIGLIKASEQLGKDAGPVVDGMRALLPDLERRAGSKGKQGDTFKPILQQTREAIAAFDAAHS